jgi:hypothetical protein
LPLAGFSVLETPEGKISRNFVVCLFRSGRSGLKIQNDYDHKNQDNRNQKNGGPMSTLDFFNHQAFQYTTDTL